MQGNGKETWAEAIDKAKDLFNAGWKELGKAAELAKERGDDAWSEAQKRGRDAWVNARAKGMETWEDAREVGVEKWKETRERGEEMLDDAEKMVRKYPARSLGVTLLVGAFIGLLLSRDRD